MSVEEFKAEMLACSTTAFPSSHTKRYDSVKVPPLIMGDRRPKGFTGSESERFIIENLCNAGILRSRPSGIANGRGSTPSNEPPARPIRPEAGLDNPEDAVLKCDYELRRLSDCFEKSSCSVHENVPYSGTIVV